MNFVDLAILIVVGYYVYEARKTGLLHQSFELLSMLFSLLFALFFYAPVGRASAWVFGKLRFHISPVWSNPLGFFIVWFIVESLLFLTLHMVMKKFNISFAGSKNDRKFSFIPAIFKGLIFSAIFLSLIVSLPVSGGTKNEVYSSFIGSRLVSVTDTLNSSFDNIFSGAVRQTLNFITIKPESEATYDLGFKTTKFHPDEAAENKMLELVNNERQKAGLPPLILDARLRDIARAHSAEMLTYGYFSHTDRAGQGPCERMDAAHITYAYCGENIAYAPDVDTAHRGLMNSPGHRANILSPNYTRIGIGIMNAGAYGEMFTQDFTG